jgi:hypothetical protein
MLTLGKIGKTLEKSWEALEIFWKNFGKSLENLEKILRIPWKNLEKILKKSWKNLGEILEEIILRQFS